LRREEDRYANPAPAKLRGAFDDTEDNALFNALGKMVYDLMMTFNGWLQNPVLTVVVFTVILRLVMSPLDFVSRKAMQKQTAAQPYIARIQKKYAGNPQVMQKKMGEFNKKHGISMLKGCLPMLLTLPLFIVFLDGMTTWGNVSNCNIYLQAEAGNYDISGNSWLWINNIWSPDSGLSDVILSGEEFAKIPIDNISEYFTEDQVASLTAAAENSGAKYTTVMQPLADKYSGYKNGWFILPVLSAVFVLLQAYATQGPKKDRPKPVEGMPKTGGMGMNIFIALFSGYICLKYNAMFAIYWMVSNLCAILLTLLLRKIYPAHSYVFEGEEALQ